MRYEKAEFLDSRIELDENEFVDCKFLRCRLVYAGGTPPVLSGCSFTNTGFDFDGAATRTIAFLRGLYHGGIRPPVDGVIESIKTQKPAGDKLQ